MQAQVGFKVWGKIAGDAFEKVFPTVAAWKAWRRLNERRYEIEVFGMKSEAA
ncbi:hypothetical protein Brsp07_05486 [Brucella sp. NBRC 14130]|uniref:hypothetical protein n=1 Tax=Brucella sp. NBRC 14130 TaxID=3075483 RepID=UPI00309B5A93